MQSCTATPVLALALVSVHRTGQDKTLLVSYLHEIYRSVVYRSNDKRISFLQLLFLVFEIKINKKYIYTYIFLFEK